MSNSDLPAGWVMKESKSHPGHFYYFHAESGKSVWEKPQVQSNILTQVTCSHLLVKHQESRRPASHRDPQGIEIQQRTKEEAIELVKKYKERIVSGTDTFADLASQYSDCSSAKRQGNLGPFTRGQMQKPFEDASFALNINEISDIVDTDSGIHVILRTA